MMNSDNEFALIQAVVDHQKQLELEKSPYYIPPEDVKDLVLKEMMLMDQYHLSIYRHAAGTSWASYAYQDEPIPPIYYSFYDHERYPPARSIRTENGNEGDA